MKKLLPIVRYLQKTKNELTLEIEKIKKEQPENLKQSFSLSQSTLSSSVWGTSSILRNSIFQFSPPMADSTINSTFQQSSMMTSVFQDQPLEKKIKLKKNDLKDYMEVLKTFRNFFSGLNIILIVNPNKLELSKETQKKLASMLEKYFDADMEILCTQNVVSKEVLPKLHWLYKRWYSILNNLSKLPPEEQKEIENNFSTLPLKAGNAETASLWLSLTRQNYMAIYHHILISLISAGKDASTYDNQFWALEELITVVCQGNRNNLYAKEITEETWTKFINALPEETHVWVFKLFKQLKKDWEEQPEEKKQKKFQSAIKNYFDTLEKAILSQTPNQNDNFKNDLSVLLLPYKTFPQVVKLCEELKIVFAIKKYDLKSIQKSIEQIINNVETSDELAKVEEFIIDFETFVDNISIKNEPKISCKTLISFTIDEVLKKWETIDNPTEISDEPDFYVDSSDDEEEDDEEAIKNKKKNLQNSQIFYQDDDDSSGDEEKKIKPKTSSASFLDLSGSIIDFGNFKANEDINQSTLNISTFNPSFTNKKSTENINLPQEKKFTPKESKILFNPKIITGSEEKKIDPKFNENLNLSKELEESIFLPKKPEKEIKKKQKILKLDETIFKNFNLDPNLNQPKIEEENKNPLLLQSIYPMNKK